MAFDLDDEELKATRILNRVNKENNNIEKDVERCKQLIRKEHANWIGISNQLAIKHILEELKQYKKKTKELEEENKRKDMFVEMAKEVIENSILKQKVIDKININNNIMLETKNKYPSTYTALDEWRNAKAQNEVLEKILEEK